MLGLLCRIHCNVSLLCLCSKTVGKEDAALLSQQTQEKDENEGKIDSNELYSTFLSVVE